MFERVAEIFHRAASLVDWDLGQVVRSGADVMRDAVAFDKAGSVLVTVVVVACMFIVPRN